MRCGGRRGKTGTGGGAPHRPSPCVCRGPSCGAAGYAGQARGGTGKKRPHRAGQARCITTRVKPAARMKAATPHRQEAYNKAGRITQGKKRRFF